MGKRVFTLVVLGLILLTGIAFANKPNVYQKSLAFTSTSGVTTFPYTVRDLTILNGDPTSSIYVGLNKTSASSWVLGTEGSFVLIAGGEVNLYDAAIDTITFYASGVTVSPVMVLATY
jgi:hypothetical protein